ncbi:MAG: FAD-binding oxidoreductase [bacterium]
MIRSLEEIKRVCPGIEYSCSPEVCVCYSFDATGLKSIPQAVVFPRNLDDVRQSVRHLTEEGIGVVPRGAGTGFAGGTVPIEDSVVLSMEKMNRIIKIDRDERTATVEPGVVNAMIQQQAMVFDLMFPPDPSSLEVSTIGGNVAQDAGGPRALKYGVTRHYVLEIEFVTWDGSVSSTNQIGQWQPILSLLIGSEGTLAVMTRFKLKLIPLPRFFSTMLVFFNSTSSAAEAVSGILESGVMPSAIELMDRSTLNCITQYIEVELPSGTGCALIVEIDGTSRSELDYMKMVKDVVGRHEPIDMRVATDSLERERLWQMRRSVSPSLARIAPSKLNEDVCVPRSKLPKLVEIMERLSKKYKLMIPTFGHAGDGNLHVNVMFDKRNPDQLRRAEAVVEELFSAVIEMGGSISGEHGIGIAKQQFLKKQVGEQGLNYLRAIRQAFDPRGFINPGKVIPL